MDRRTGNLANAASLLWHGLKALPEPSNGVNWAGFYVRDGPDNLILGPFQGRVACQTISFSRGVCGRAARTAETQIVDDVHSDVSHVACDSSTKSEIVVPILFNGEVVGVIDIDCEEEKGFTGEDREALERIAMLLAAGCDWASLKTK
ncbi:hypothetical protein TWF106_002760 [Orbilia oligospora]|uniref:GAF domain-containing protein n=1 Tax=Orbilia oligospora TaxID=2813651 RepID=A0A7C8Q8E7_ORBOL|nr:hypothetical protein TWF106_002760 [Orbilia oligospora]